MLEKLENAGKIPDKSQKKVRMRGKLRKNPGKLENMSTEEGHIFHLSKIRGMLHPCFSALPATCTCCDHPQPHVPTNHAIP